MLQDIAVLTGGQAISEDLGIKMENVTLAMLGRAKKVMIDKENHHHRQRRRQEVRHRGAGGADQGADRGNHLGLPTVRSCRSRLAKLAGGVAVIRVGGATEVEVKERKDRVDDAMHATRAAVEEGIVPGGGVALLRASEQLKGIRTKNDDQKTGVEIVAQGAVLAGPPDRDPTRARTAPSSSARSREQVVQLRLRLADRRIRRPRQRKGIIDPTKVVRAAIQNAASVAALLITTEAMVAELPKKNAGGGGGMPPGGGNGRHGFLIHSLHAIFQECKTPAQCRGFFV